MAAPRTAPAPPKPPRRITFTRSGGGGSNFRFVQDTVSELKKVVWPTREQTLNLSLIVIAASAGVGIALGTIDWIFTRVVDAFLNTGAGTTLPPIG